MQRVLIVGGGFAGFWAAANAARVRSLHPAAENTIDITLVDRNAYHDIRVLNYERTPSTTYPLPDLLAPIGVQYVQATVTGLDLSARSVAVTSAAGPSAIHYDVLVDTLGSHVFEPALPGLDRYAFRVDTHADAERLQQHLAALPQRPRADRYTAVVVGAGLAGIEACCELPARLATIRDGAGDAAAPIRVLLVDSAQHIGSNMGAEACRVIDEALAAQHIETRTGVKIVAVNARGLVLAGGATLEAATVIWCAGMRANNLGAALGVPLDRFGRVEVDRCMQVRGRADVFAAGDTAWFEISPGHGNVMSCQHGIAMGCHAGANAVARLTGDPLLPLQIDRYVTYLDLGAWGAVCTHGWDRHVVAVRDAAKQIKLTTTHRNIEPPATLTREAIFKAATDEIHTPPGWHAPTRATDPVEAA